MNDLEVGEYNISNLSTINILLGKNGCGKSTLLKIMEEKLQRDKDYGMVSYITPERGGVLIYDSGVEQQIVNKDSNLHNTRRQNQLSNFRQQSVAQFRELRLLFADELESNNELRADFNYTFDNYLDRLNGLLDNIFVKRNEHSLSIHTKDNPDQEIKPDKISSGEAELISLGIECLVFEKKCDKGKNNVLLLDEPDVHLHPDLQARLSHFLLSFVNEKNFSVIIATHSTAFLGALESFENTHIHFMTSGCKKIEFKKISEEYKRILPVFGAHPLSNIYNNSPILLVEGEDDVRIWQQAVRSSKGKLKIYPCGTNGNSKMGKYEKDVNEIIASVYDNARAYSIRDRDEKSGSIKDEGVISRFFLECRAAENLLLSDEVLISLGTEWDELKKKIESWIEANESHLHKKEFNEFKEAGYDRKGFDIKELRNDLLSIMGKSVGWEVAIGKVLGQLKIGDSIKVDLQNEHSIASYLGAAIVNELFE